MSQQLANMLEALETAGENVAKALVNDYPVGGSVSWERGGKIYTGHVTGHSYSDRIKVMNGTTLADYWIHASDIERAWRAGR